MATIVYSWIGSGNHTGATNSVGGSYTNGYSTIQAWLDAAPANLVSSDQVWQGECFNDTEFAGNLATVAGHSDGNGQTDATRYFKLTTAPNQSFSDHADKETNPLRYDQSKGVGIRITGDYDRLFVGSGYTKIVFEKLQFYSDKAADYAPHFSLGYLSEMRNCIYQTRAVIGGSTSNEISASNNSFINTHFISNGTTYGGRIIGAWPAAGQRANFVACTFVRPSNLAAGAKAIVNEATAPAPLVLDCAFFGFTTPSTADSYAAGSGYNASDAASLPGSSNQTSLNYTSGGNEVQFIGSTSSAMDFRVKTGSDMIGNGGNSTTTGAVSYTSDKDVAMRDRSATAPTIGAWEGGAQSVIKRGMMMLGVG